MIKIGEFSKITKTTIKALRYYDKINLLKPHFVDVTGYRFYEVEQMNDLIFILEMRKLDMPIADIKKVLISENKSEFLTTQLRFLEREKAKRTRQIALITNYIKKAKKGEIMEKYVPKEIIVPSHVVYFKHGIIDKMSDINEFVLKAGGGSCTKQSNIRM